MMPTKNEADFEFSEAYDKLSEALNHLCAILVRDAAGSDDFDSTTTEDLNKAIWHMLEAKRLISK